MTMTVRVDPNSIAALIKRLNPDQVNRRVKSGINESLGYLQAEVIKEMARDTGVGIGSVFTDLRGTSLSSLRGVVGSAQTHVLVMERGRQPGGRMPPLGPIRLWLRRHGGSEKNAFIVARSIARRGTFNRGRGLKMFEKAARSGVGVVSSIIRRHLRGL